MAKFKTESDMNFTEFPSCALCGSEKNKPFLKTEDGMQLVKCTACNLVFTSPRIEISEWLAFLKEDNERNKTYTENRLKYGIALDTNIHKSTPDWRIRISGRNNIGLSKAKEIEKIERLHDVGCGVGFLLCDARDQGIQVSGNEMNAYACSAMQERFGLTVWNCNFNETPIKAGSLDMVTMTDYIEHTYQPLIDLQFAFKCLRPGGILWLKTFHIDCVQFETLKGKWPFLWWCHIYHFSPRTLKEMIQKAGFNILQADYSNLGTSLIKIMAQKPYGKV